MSFQDRQRSVRIFGLFVVMMLLAQILSPAVTVETADLPSEEGASRLDSDALEDGIVEPSSPDSTAPTVVPGVLQSPIAPPTPPELCASLSVAPAAASPGDLVTYTLSMTNTGRVMADRVEARAQMPRDLELVGFSSLYELELPLGSLPPGAQRSRQFSARLVGLPTRALSLTVSLTTAYLPGAIEASAELTVTPPPARRATVPVEGGQFDSGDGRLGIEIPTGAITRPITITYQLLEMHRVPAGTRGLALQVALEAHSDPARQRPLARFNLPITLTLDLGDLVDLGSLGDFDYFYLGYRSDDNPEELIPVRPDSLDPRTGRVQLRTDHFSTWEGGLDGGGAVGWHLVFNDATVSSFNGGLSYQYPIQLPPGRNGLTPAVSLFYSSKRADGLLAWTQSDWAGLGWSIDTVEIARKVTDNINDGSPYNEWKGGDQKNGYENAFNLLINGTSYELVYGGTDANQRYGRYYAEQNPSLYVERRNHLSGDPADNTTGEYWIVRTPDGTEYRLGYESDAEQTVNSMIYNILPENASASDFAGWTEHVVAFRWRVDRVRDLYGNEMRYSYHEQQEEDSYECQDTWNESSQTYTDTLCLYFWDHASYLKEIEYGLGSSDYAYKVVFDRSARTGEGPHPVAEDGLWFQDDYLDAIRVLDSSDLLLAKYDLSYETPGNNGAYDHRILTSITQYGRDGTSTLPATEFSYDEYNNRAYCALGDNCPNGENPWEQYAYERLVAVRNGYGAVISVTYEHDGRDFYWFRNYQVAAKRISDGRGHQSVISYTYGTRCYDNSGQSCADYPYSTSLVGHEQSTVVVTGYEEEELSRTVHYFKTDLYRIGKEYQTDLQDADEGLLQRVEQTWSDDNDDCPEDGLPSGFHYVCLKESKATSYDPSGTDSLVRKVTYKYDPAMQGEVQYGMQTQANEYDAEQDRRRIAQTEYEVNSSDWLIVPIWSASFDTDWNLLGVTFNLYDDSTDPDGQTVVSGTLTAQRTLATLPSDGGCDGATVRTMDSVDTSFSYDSYGNLTETLSYEGYGTIQCSNDNWSSSGSLGGGADTRSNQIGYDDDGLYPVLITNTLEMTTATGYDEELPWLTAVVTDSNGAATHSQYDVFGRLKKVFRPGDDLGGTPSRQFSYSDTAFDNWMPFQVDVWVKTDPDAGTVWESGGLWQRSFYDGLGRLIQTQSPAQDWACASGDVTGHDIVQAFGYDALGNQITATVPYSKTAYEYDPGDPESPYVAAVGNVAQTETLYDALGRSVQMLAPDDSAATTLYGVGSVITVDPNRHFRVALEDELGRLGQVVETLMEWKDDFEEVDGLSGWTTHEGNGSIAESGGLLHVTGAGDWNTYLHRPADNLEDGQGVILDFKYDPGTVNSAIYLHRGTWNSSSYRRWGLSITNTISLETYSGVISTKETTPLLSLETGVWYRAVLQVGGESEFLAQVWKRDDPASSAQYREAKGSAWQDLSWNLQIQQHTGTLRVDDVEELGFYRTQYDYDLQGNLIVVTDSLTNTTVITYDALGRKTSMDDPDMGAWSYEYDPAGSLISQTDALDQSILFSYDDLGRLITRTHSGATLASYSYDEGNYGMGRRTRMSDPSGSTTWAYDQRGRLVTEVRVIDGAGTYTTSYSYDALDRPSTITYPGGEVVTTTYNAQGLPDSLVGNDDYVEDASYNALGQPRRLGLGNTLDLWYDYYSAAENNSRLQSLLVTDGSEDLLDLAYHYDLAGNILLITDTVNSGQVQSFGYDALDRLTGAATSGGGAATYVLTYTYDIIGNIDLKVDDGTTYNYSYGDGDHVHAVTSVSASSPNGGGGGTIASSGWSYQYDANGNMSYRSDATGSYSQTFDVQNRLIVVTNTQTLSVTQFVYDGDGNRVLAVYPDESQTAYPGEHYEEHFSMVEDETTTLQPWRSGVDSYVNSQYPNSNYGNSSALYFGSEFSLGGGGSDRQKRFLIQFDLSEIPGNATVDDAVLTFYCAKSQTGNDLNVNLYRVTGSWTESGVTWNNQPSVNYSSEGTITVDSTSLSVYTVSLTSLVQGWVDGTWTNRGVMGKMTAAGFGFLQGYCVASDSWTASQRPKLEVDWHIEDIQRSYYYLGGQRIALRVEEGQEDDVYWLHTDHLGSTSLLSTITGTQVSGSTTRFLPFGDYRTEPESDLTDKGFTGHAHNSYIKLVDMRARWYSPSVGRFIQPDTIVPDFTKPQSLNRYSYVSNRPMILVDPSGHDPMFPMIDGMYGVGYQGPVYSLPPSLERFARAFSYIYQEMFENARGESVALIRSWNKAAEYAIESQNAALLSHANDWGMAALTAWASKVAPGREWDHKPILDEMLGLGSDPQGADYYFPIAGDMEHEWYYDLWSNIHYGYVGAAAGFDAETLLAGPGEALLAGRNDHADTLSVQIGIDLWNDYGLELAPEQLWLAILEHYPDYLAIQQHPDYSEELDRVIMVGDGNGR